MDYDVFLKEVEEHGFIWAVIFNSEKNIPGSFFDNFGDFNQWCEIFRKLPDSCVMKILAIQKMSIAKTFDEQRKALSLLNELFLFWKSISSDLKETVITAINLILSEMTKPENKRTFDEWFQVLDDIKLFDGARNRVLVEMSKLAKTYEQWRLIYLHSRSNEINKRAYSMMNALIKNDDQYFDFHFELFPASHGIAISRMIKK